MFFAETEGELTLGSAAAFAADSVWRGNRAKQSNTPSVSPQKRRRSTFLREEGFKKKPLFIIDRVKAKSQFIISLHDRRVCAGVLPRRLAGAAPFMYNFRLSVRSVALCDRP
ncbi:hypothetical protein [Cloacibacillus porcorum]